MMTSSASSASSPSAAWLAAGLCLSRVIPPGAEAADRAGPWILATIAERLELPPAGVVADLGALLFGTSLDTLRAPPSSNAIIDVELAIALRRYEDNLLGRLAADARLLAAGFAALRLPPSHHAHAVAILVAGVLDRIGFKGGVAVPPGVVRTLTERTPTETARRGFASLRDDARTRKMLADEYAELARGAQKARELLSTADIFALENLTVLGSLAQRMAIADVVRTADQLDEALPKRLMRRRKKQEGSTATQLEEESTYPAGGFASMSTSGSLENLVASELIYMDPPGRAHVDLFDLRYVEGELLYYTRDEAIHIRQRRIVLFTFAAELSTARVKDPGVPAQRLVMALGLLLLVVKKLAALLSEESLQVRVTFLFDDEGLEPLAEERALATLLLREWIERGLVEVAVGTWADVRAAVAGAQRRAVVDIVRVSGDTSQKAPPSLDPRIAAHDFTVARETFEAWCEATRELLSKLL